MVFVLHTRSLVIVNDADMYSSPVHVSPVLQLVCEWECSSWYSLSPTHNVHVLASTALSALIFSPGPHTGCALQLSCPISSWNVFWLQSIHCTCPRLSWYLPTGQLMQSCAPACAEYFPLVHTAHAELSSASPSPSPCFPAAQSMQLE